MQGNFIIIHISYAVTVYFVHFKCDYLTMNTATCRELSNCLSTVLLKENEEK
jgi:hypothetical protein